MEKTKRVASTPERLKLAMADANVKQIDLSRTTGLSHSTISRYLSGAVEPRQTATHKLAIALNVNELWLWGYDVPRERVEVVPNEISEKNDLAAQFLSKMVSDDKFLNAVWRLTKMDDVQLEAFSRLDDEQFLLAMQLFASFEKK